MDKSTKEEKKICSIDSLATMGDMVAYLRLERKGSFLCPPNISLLLPEILHLSP